MAAAGAPPPPDPAGDRYERGVRKRRDVVGRQEVQARSYMRNALRLGWTREELVEALVHLAPDAGVPTVHTALDALAGVLAEADAPGRPP